MMQPTYPARAAICIALLTIIVACSKKMDTEPAPAAAPAPVIAEAMAPPPTAKISVSTPVMAERAAVSFEEEKRKVADKTFEPGTTVSRTGVDRTAQLTSSAATYIDGERKFIRTASANFRVKDVYQSANAIEDVVAGLGGFVVQNNIASRVQGTQRHPIGDGKLMELSEYTVEGQLIVRVPSPKTQEFLRAIANQIAFLDQRNFAAHDAQFDMLRKQLDYARNQETQEELGQTIKEGGKLEQRADAINSRNEAKAARDEAKVQKKEFDDQVAFSTVSFSIYQLPNVVETEIRDIDAVFRQNRPGFLDRLSNAGIAGWDRLLDFSISAFALWPLWIVVALIVAVFLRFKRRKPTASA